MIEEQQPETPQPKLVWVKPETRRLDVGDAEGGDSVAGDGANSLS